MAGGTLLDRLVEEASRPPRFPKAGEDYVVEPIQEGPKPRSLLDRIAAEANEPSAGEMLQGVAAAAGQGLAEFGAFMEEGIGLAERTFEPPLRRLLTGQHVTEAEKGRMTKRAAKRADYARRFWTETLKVPERAEGTLPVEVARAGGQSLQFAAAALVPGVNEALAVAAFGAAQGLVGGFYEAKAAGADDSTAWLEAMAGGALGGTEAVPLAGIYARLNKATGGRLLGALRTALLEGGEEAAQELLQTGVGDLVHESLTGEDRANLERLAQSGKVAPAAGFIMSLLGSSRGIARGLRGRTKTDEGSSSVRQASGTAQPTTAQQALTAEAPSDERPASSIASSEQVQPSATAATPIEQAAGSVEVPLGAPDAERAIQPAAPTAPKIDRPLVSDLQGPERSLVVEIARGNQIDPTSISVHEPTTEDEKKGAEIAKARGARVLVVDAGRALARPAAYSEGTILVDANAPEGHAKRALILHELVHSVADKSQETVQKLAAKLEQLDPDGFRAVKADYLQRFRATAEPGSATIPRGVRVEEGAANYVQELASYVETALSDPERLVRVLGKEGRSFLTRLLDALKETLAKFNIRFETSQKKELKALKAELARTPLEQAVSPEVAARAALAIRAALNRGLDISTPSTTELTVRSEATAPSPETLPTPAAAPVASTTALPAEQEVIAPARPSPTVAAMPTEAGLFGPQEREARAPVEVAAPRVVQPNLLDVQAGDLPGQTTLLDRIAEEAMREPTTKKPAKPKRSLKEKIRERKLDAQHGSGTLEAFVRAHGGIKIEGSGVEGELKALREIGKSPGMFGLGPLVRQKSGGTYDEMIEAAVDAGYFPGKTADEVEVSDLIEAISEGRTTQDRLAQDVEAEHERYLQEQERRWREDLGEEDSQVPFAVAYHGSPYDFEKFLMEKIGTGEGAQAYGHGLYFASKKGVADYYRRALAERTGPTLTALSPAENALLPNWVKRTLAMGDQLSIDEMRADWNQRAASDHPNRAELVKIRDTIERAVAGGDFAHREGRTYEVELAPAEDEYLLWDSVDQSPKVMRALESTDWFKYARERLENLPGNWGGSDLYYYLKEDMPAEEASAMLRSAGIRGIKYLDQGSRGSGEGSYNYVLFSEEDVSIRAKYAVAPPDWLDDFIARGHRVEPDGSVVLYHGTTKDGAERIKRERVLRAAAGSSEEYGVHFSTSPDIGADYGDGTVLAIRLRPADLRLEDEFPNGRMDFSAKTRGLSYRPLGFAGDRSEPRFAIAPQHKGGVFLRIFQDRLSPLKQAEREVAARGANWLYNVDDPSLAEELRAGRTKAAMDRFKARYVDPILALLRKGITAKEASDYLQARHVPERNRELTKLGVVNGSGRTDAWAAGVMAKVAADPRAPIFERIARIHDRMHKEIRATWAREGLETQDFVDELEAKYKFYTPLKTDMADEALGIGQGLALLGRETRRALGRSTEADNSLAFSFTQSATSIVRAEKARVDQAVLEFVKATADPQFATIGAPQVRRGISPQTGLAGPVLDPRYNWRDNVLPVKVGGNVVPITFAEEHTPLALALKNGNTKHIWQALDFLRRYTRWFTAMATRWNPAFVPFNVLRDIPFAALKTFGEQGPLAAARLLSRVPGAWRTIYTANRNLDLRRDDHKLWLRWKNAGGPISTLELDTFEDSMRRIQKSLDRGPAGFAWDAVTEYMGLLSDVAEQGSRFATFRALVESGMSDEKAALASKDVTVNFERKGDVGPLVNALYGFWNAGVQGADAVAKTMRHPRTWKALAGATAAMAVLDILMRSISDEDEDGELFYDKIPEHEKRTGIVLMKPDGRGHFTIPLPRGFGWFFYLGNQVGAVTRGPKGPGQAAANLGVAMLEEFNPFGGYGPIEQGVAPTAVDPLVQAMTNRDWRGKPLKPENYGNRKPESEVFYPNVSPTALAFARWLNRVTDPSDTGKGALDVSPELLEHFAQSAFSGLGRTATQVYDVADKAIRGEPIEARDWPVYGRIVKDPNPFYIDGKYRENERLVGDRARRLKELEGRDEEEGTERARAFLEEYGFLVDLDPLRKETERDLDKMRDEGATDEEMRRVKAEFNRIVLEASRGVAQEAVELAAGKE